MTIQWGKRFGRKGQAQYVSLDGRWMLVQKTYQYKPNNTAKSKTVTDWYVWDRFAPVETDPCKRDESRVAKADTKKECLERFERRLAKGLIPVYTRPADMVG